MKLILSRKGFDQAAGGGASPILPGGELCSLPIPDSLSGIDYSDIRCSRGSLADIIAELHPRFDLRARTAHLDPDLRYEAVDREPDWRPLFGQAGAAQSHLANHGVEKGDLFLFFGWFREACEEKGCLQWHPDARDRHILFGWLRVASVWREKELADAPKWARGHPHIAYPARRNNAVYVAARGDAGIFPHCHPELVLTATGMPRSVWTLSRCFARVARDGAMSYHRDPRRWQVGRNEVMLRTAGRGQEFVIDLETYKHVRIWAERLVQQHGRS